MTQWGMPDSICYQSKRKQSKYEFFSTNVVRFLIFISHSQQYTLNPNLINNIQRYCSFNFPIVYESKNLLVTWAEKQQTKIISIMNAILSMKSHLKKLLLSLQMTVGTKLSIINGDPWKYQLRDNVKIMSSINFVWFETFTCHASSCIIKMWSPLLFFHYRRYIDNRVL